MEDGHGRPTQAQDSGAARSAPKASEATLRLVNDEAELQEVTVDLFDLDGPVLHWLDAWPARRACARRHLDRRRAISDELHSHMIGSTAAIFAKEQAG